MTDVRAASSHPNVIAFKRCVREKESNQIDSGPDSAYTLVNGGKHFFDFTDHPYKGLSTFHGGRAAGVAQFLPSTWGEMQQKYSLPDFTPDSQEIAFTGCIEKRGALDDVIAGRFEDAVAKCRLEWTSLPGASESRSSWTLDKARDVYLKWGGQLDGAQVATQPATPVQDKSEPYIGAIGGADNSNTPMFTLKENTVENTTGAKPMGALALLQLFAPMLQSLIPQITSLFHPKGDVAQRNTQLAQTVLDTILQASGQPNLQAAIEQMQASSATQQTVQAAIVSHPDIMPYLVVETGGGSAAVRDYDVKVMQSDKPFWKTSSVFWISVMMLPMILWYVGSTIVGGIEIPADWPWYGQLPLKMFGAAWSPDARAGIANLVIGLALGGVCGVYFGVSVTQKANNALSKD